MSAMRLAELQLDGRVSSNFGGLSWPWGHVSCRAGSGAATLGSHRAQGYQSQPHHTLVANFNDLDSVASHEAETKSPL